jgi:hypothetical protein
VALVHAIRGHSDHRALRRSPDGRVALIVKEAKSVLSTDGPARRTVEVRLSRLAAKLQDALGEGWQLSSRRLKSKWTFQRRAH